MNLRSKKTPVRSKFSVQSWQISKRIGRGFTSLLNKAVSEVYASGQSLFENEQQHLREEFQNSGYQLVRVLARP